MITSRSNPRVVRARGLRRRADRDASGLCLVEGIRVVYEAERQRAAIEELVVAPDLLRSDLAWNLVQRIQSRGTPTLEVSAEVFASISSRDGPRGIAAVVRQRWTSLADAEPGDSLGWVALDAVQDPGNLGTILRTCDAVGSAGVILLGDTADPYDPSAVRSSTGAVFTRRLVRASFDQLVEWKRSRGARLVGASGRAALGYRAAVYRPPFVLVMGSEQKGLPESALALCDAAVSIPMLGSCDSLNLAVATSVILYEALHQRPLASGEPSGGAPTDRRAE